MFTYCEQVGALCHPIGQRHSTCRRRRKTQKLRLARLQDGMLFSVWQHLCSSIMFHFMSVRRSPGQILEKSFDNQPEFQPDPSLEIKM